MNHADLEYHRYLQEILELGERRGDRTGTGTISHFRPKEMRFDLQKGFPLMTTKKTAWKAVVRELLWFLAGETNVKPLIDAGCNIWTPDAYRGYKNRFGEKEMSFEEYVEAIKTSTQARPAIGELGPIYGHGWRKWGEPTLKNSQPEPKIRDGLKHSYLGVANGSGSSKHPLGKTWEGMIARCYDTKSSSYHLYGGRGVYVADRWLEFKAFAEDATKIPGWENKKKDSAKRFVLDKDILGDGFVYSKDTCSWVTDEENSAVNASPDRVFTVEKEGVQYQFMNITKFCEEQGIDARNFSDLWTGRKNAKIRYGFKLVKVESLNNNGVDQIRELIQSIKVNPTSRRHIVTAWNPGQLGDMVLPPCHILFQAYVSNDGGLSLALYQR